MSTETTRQLRAWAQDADDHGNHWVPVSQATLRDLADKIDQLVSAASAGTDEYQDRAVSPGRWFGPHRATLLRNALAKFSPPPTTPPSGADKE